MKLLKPVLLVGGLYTAYRIYQNARVDPNETFLDGWQETAKHMRPTPKSLIELQNETFPRAPLPAE